MKKNIPTLTIGIPAYNEEKNIVNIVRSVFNQKIESGNLKRVLVICDGCTDRTVKNLSMIKNHKLKISLYKTRKGKAYRLNQIFKEVNTDIFIQIDADIILENEHVIHSLIKPFTTKFHEILAAGNTIPLEPTKFIEKAIMTTFNLYYSLRFLSHGGNNIYSADGKIMAYSKKLYKKIIFPSNLLSEDAYAYLLCLRDKYSYRFVSDAVVRYRLPNTIKDQIKQNSRFMAGSRQLNRIFDVSVTSQAYQKPSGKFIVGMMKAFIHNPVMTTYIKIINLYCMLISSHEKYNKAKWDISSSTKREMT